MSQNGGATTPTNSSGPDFHLPDSILAVIPTDPYDQLDIARKITSMAIASRVSKLESENTRLRHKISDKDRLISELNDQLNQLDRILQDSEERLRISVEENHKLVKEKEMMAFTSKRLSRDLSKLESFKRQLMQSLKDDNSSQQSEAVDVGTFDQPVAKVSSWKDESSISDAGSDMVSGAMETGDTVQSALRHSSSMSSFTPYVTPRLTPTTTPKVSSIGGSPRGFSTAGSSPSIASGHTSPTKPRFDSLDGRSSFSSWYPSSQQSSAPSSPPRGRSLSGRTRIDGKEFFRQARSRLSYEQFGAFLSNIKELNANRQTREETLEKAEEIFGTDNKDLYLSFQGLLNRNLP